MGPTCEVIFEAPLGDRAVDETDALLAGFAERVERTRKGRVWDIWIKGRPIHVAAELDEPELHIHAGCNSSEDYEIVSRLAETLALAFDGVAGTPEK